MPSHDEVIWFGAGGNAGVLQATCAESCDGFGFRDDGHAGGNQERCDFGLNLLGGEHGDGFGVVGHGVETIGGFNH